MKYIEIKNKILNDKYTEYIYEAFDIQNKEETIVKIPINFSECKNFNWNIGVIYGGSGSGKTTLLKDFGILSTDTFDEKKPLISNFDWLEPKDAAFLLSAMGLSSVPTWLRPFNLLSNGEQYRASLAYKVGKSKENQIILIDEFTSVVDRDVAKAMSYAIQKYIRINNKKIILASCHFDIMDWLMPDWTYSPIKGRIERYEYARRERPRIELSLFRCRYETWDLFKQHHYLTEDLNKAAKCFIIIFNEKPCCFIAILPSPSGYYKDGFRVSRLVVLPDFQGLGIGYKVLNYISSLYLKDNKSMYIKTSNPSLTNNLENNLNWKKVKDFKNIESLKKHNEKIQNKHKIKVSISKSFKYIGLKSEDDLSIIKFKNEVYKDVSQNQTKLF
jgi:ABC-type lipoprotein export system ATPase subunit